MKNMISAEGKAIIMLRDSLTGKISNQVTVKNTVNLDYIAEMRNSIFGLSSALTLYLSDYDQPAPENGLIFPMGHFLGYGKYNTGSSGLYQGAWSATNAKLNEQLNGLTKDKFAWEFTATQAMGTLRSLFLFLDTTATHYPSLYRPTLTWKGTPRWCIENKVLEYVAKTATQYCVADYQGKTVDVREKSNTLTVSGIARDADTGHIFVYDSAVKKLYEYADVDTDFTSANVITEYPCTKAYVGSGLIRGDNLFYMSGNVDPVSSAAATPGGDQIYLFKYAYKDDDVPELIDTMTRVQASAYSFQADVPTAFIDDYLIKYNYSNANYRPPVLKICGDTAKMGFYANAGSSSYTILQRVAAGKQLLLNGTSSSETANTVLQMGISHLLLPEPIVKDNQHSLSVTYTLTLQE